MDAQADALYDGLSMDPSFRTLRLLVHPITDTSGTIVMGTLQVCMLAGDHACEQGMQAGRQLGVWACVRACGRTG